MLKSILFTALVACGFIIVNGFGERMLGPGKWFVINIMKCEEDGDMLYKIEINRRKINRTHDGFNGKITVGDAIDGSFGVLVDICKFVDGGCKPYQKMADESFERFCKKWSKDNIERLFRLANIDPPDFPLPVGTHEIANFVMDYDQLPENGQYGEYLAKAFLMKDGLKKACVTIHVRFTDATDD